MTSLPSGGLHTPRDSLHQDNPTVLSTPNITTLGDRAFQQQAQQALYRGISTSSGSVCRPLTYSAVSNRYSSDPSIPASTKSVGPSVVLPTPIPGRCQNESYPHVIQSAPPAREGYFRDPFGYQDGASYPPFFGPNQLYFSSACHPRDTNHPFRAYPPPPPHGLAAHPVGSPNWVPASKQESALPSVMEQASGGDSIPDFLSGDAFFETHSVGCQVQDDVFGFGNNSPVYPGHPNHFYNGFAPQVFSPPVYPVPSSAPVVVKDALKLNIPIFNDKKSTWAAYAPKLRAALLECNMSHLLYAENTNATNAAQSKELMLQFYKKLEGSAAKLFSSMESEQFYMEGGRGVEMLHLLASTFNPLDDEAVREIIKQINNFELDDSQDLSTYFDALTDWNSQLSWVGQSFPMAYLVQVAVAQLSKSRFAASIKQLQFFHTASKTSFTSLEDIKSGLTRLDTNRGLSTVAVVIPSPGGTKKPWRKSGSGTPEGLVSSVVQGDSPTSDTESGDTVLHSLPWIGGLELSAKQVQKIKSDFKCFLCRTQKHPWPMCPFLTKWEIKKKPEERPTRGRTSPTGSAAAVTGSGENGSATTEVAPLGTANSVRFDTEASLVSLSSDVVDDNRFAPLQTIEESDDESFAENVVPDYADVSELLSVDVDVTVSSGNDSFYSPDLLSCLGSARSVSASSSPVDSSSLIPPSFPVVADSGATNSMVPWQELFIDYKKCNRNSYVLLANNQKASCIGRGTIKIDLGGVIVVITNVLHVPSLRCPLYSIRCHSRIRGCAFHADNKGVILAFPEFILPVDISTDCIIQGKFPPIYGTVRFDERNVGSVSAVSDNTRNRHKRRGVVPRSSGPANCQEQVHLPDAPSNSIPVPDFSESSPSDPIVVEAVTDVDDLNDKSVVNDDDDNDECDDLLLDPLLIDSLANELGLDPSVVNPSSTAPSLSQKQIGEIAQACVKILQEHGRITPALLTFLSTVTDGSSNNPTSMTPNDRPELPSNYKMPSSSPAHRRFTVQELHRYLGFRQLKNWSSVLDIAQENISINFHHGDVPIELGNVANIKKSRRNKTPIARPPNFLSRVHMDIGYGDCKAVGGARYCTLFVDRATRQIFIYGLKTLTHTALTAAFQQFRIDAGALPKVLITDFDSKIFAGKTGQWLQENNCGVRAAPPRRQNQNGLVERAWETITGMARSYITDMQMPRCYWYWALRHAVHVANLLPCTVNGLSTTPHELVYGVKPDFRTLFRLFSTGYFKHERDSTRDRDGIAESKSMCGIVIGRDRKSDGLLFYCPHTKHIYTSGDYKLDEGRNTPNTFNLKYEGGIFVGLYDSSPNTPQVEPYPQGTSVVWPLKDISNKTVIIRGTVISVPLPLSDCQIPASADDAPPYVIKLVDGSTHRVAPLLMDDIVVSSDPNVVENRVEFPSWLGNSQKVMYLKDGTYIKGVMEYDLDSNGWRFSQHRRNGTELWGVALSNFARDFQLYIDDGTIIPGWHTKAKSNCLRVGSVSHVSAAGLLSPLPPGSLAKALKLTGNDFQIWSESYKEEFFGLKDNECFEIISEEEYQQIYRSTGKRAIPSMAVFTVKKDSSGKPLRAKSRIVVLGNKDPTEWTKADCFAPVVSLPVVRMLTALAVQQKRTLKQADCKLAFIQATLPPEEITVVKPPAGCPLSGPGTYWRLKRSMYGLKRAPRHWYKLISQILTSPEIGLNQCKNDPCIYHGVLIPGQPPLYLGIYVDDIVYFSASDEVERYFEIALKAKINVDFMGDAEFFLGLKFDWLISPNGDVDCRISQEAYANSIVHELGLSQANVSPLMTPFRSGLPVDTIPHVDMTVEARAVLIGKMQCWLGMINWLTMGTRPDLGTIFSLLASNTNNPSPGHLDAVKHLGRYIKSTADLGLLFSSRRNVPLESFVHFPVNETDDLPDGGTAPTLLGFCDANWGPQDASLPGSHSSSTRTISTNETRSICGHVLMMGGAPVFWKCHKEKRISRSSCEAEVKATDECTKSVQMFRNILGDLNLINLSQATAIYNDNQGSVNWSNSSSTKGMRHVNIRENAIREAIHEFKEISVSHIPGQCNPSDIFTKEFKSDVIFRSLRGLLLFSPIYVLSNFDVPRLDGGC